MAGAAVTTADGDVDCVIAADCAGQRFDQALAQTLTGYSRARLQQWIRNGDLKLDGRTVRPRDKVWGGERITGRCRLEAVLDQRPQDLPLQVVFADDHIIVVNKPPGLVVHPAAGNRDGTLLNALLYYAPELAALPRAGLVHRLDKNTSGLLAVARSPRAHASLVAQLQTRTMGRSYDALVHGLPSAGGRVEQPLGRHPVDRKRMAVVAGGKPAITHYRIARRFRGHTRLRVKLETGRTHQIRVHMQYLRYPIVGDPTYGGRPRPPAGLGAAAIAALQTFPRQALHAAELSVEHPLSGQTLSWSAEPPADMQSLFDVLEQDYHA